MAEIELSQMIIDLRKELARAQDEGEGESIQFLVNETVLELQVKMAQKGEAGIKFYVISAGGGGSSEQSQKILIKLQPVTRIDANNSSISWKSSLFSRAVWKTYLLRFN